MMERFLSMRWLRQPEYLNTGPIRTCIITRSSHVSYLDLIFWLNRQRKFLSYFARFLHLLFSKVINYPLNLFFSSIHGTTYGVFLAACPLLWKSNLWKYFTIFDHSAQYILQLPTTGMFTTHPLSFLIPLSHNPPVIHHCYDEFEPSYRSLGLWFHL